MLSNLRREFDENNIPTVNMGSDPNGNPYLMALVKNNKVYVTCYSDGYVIAHNSTRVEANTAQEAVEYATYAPNWKGQE